MGRRERQLDASSTRAYAATETPVKKSPAGPVHSPTVRVQAESCII